MRPKLVVFALLLLPSAAALEDAPVPLVEVSVEPFAAPVRPLQGAGTTSLVTRVSCALSEASELIEVRHTIEDAPAWMDATIAPASDSVAARECENGYVRFAATLTVSVDDGAPALVPTPIRVVSHSGSAPRDARGEAVLNVTADYFGILDLSLPETILVVAPDSVATFRVLVTNHGNGRTLVSFGLDGESGTLQVAPIEPVILGSRQLGDPADAVTKEVLVHVTTAPGRGYVNRVDAFTLAATSHRVGDESRKGDETKVSFLVTTKTGGASTERTMDVPGLGAWALVGVLGACALRRSRT